MLESTPGLCISVDIKFSIFLLGGYLPTIYSTIIDVYHIYPAIRQVFFPPLE